MALWDRTLWLYRIADEKEVWHVELDEPAMFLRFTEDRDAVEYLTTWGRWGTVPVDPVKDALARAPRALTHDERVRHGLDR